MDSNKKEERTKNRSSAVPRNPFAAKLSAKKMQFPAKLFDRDQQHALQVDSVRKTSFGFIIYRDSIPIFHRAFLLVLIIF